MPAYLKFSSLQCELASPTESSSTSGSCRSFPLRSSSFRREVSELRTEANSAQHSWRLHSFNLQVRIRFVPVACYLNWKCMYHVIKPLYYLLCPQNLRDLTLTSPVYSVDFSLQHTAAVCPDHAGCFHPGPAVWQRWSQSWELSQCVCSISL